MRKRWLRVLEYEGDEEFFRISVEGRSVIGQKILPNGSIREAMIGDLPQPSVEQNAWHCIPCGIVRPYSNEDFLRCPQCEEPMGQCSMDPPPENWR